MKKMTEEHKEKIRAAILAHNQNNPRDDEHRKKISESCKARWEKEKSLNASGEISEIEKERRRKISEARKRILEEKRRKGYRAFVAKRRREKKKAKTKKKQEKRKLAEKNRRRELKEQRFQRKIKKCEKMAIKCGSKAELKRRNPRLYAWASENNVLNMFNWEKERRSSLEVNIEKLLKRVRLPYEREKTFEWLTYKGKQRLDFYLPSLKIGIECQGAQHVKDIPYWGNQLKEIKKKDANKQKLCEKHGVDIIYYTDTKENFEGDICRNNKEVYKQIRSIAKTREKNNIWMPKNIGNGQWKLTKWRIV